MRRRASRLRRATPICRPAACSTTLTAGVVMGVADDVHVQLGWVASGGGAVARRAVSGGSGSSRHGD